MTHRLSRVGYHVIVLNEASLYRQREVIPGVLSRIQTQTSPLAKDGPDHRPRAPS